MMTRRIEAIGFALLTLLMLTPSISSIKAAVTHGNYDGGETTESQLEQPTPAPPAKPVVEQSRVIDGELSSVDWNSLVGQTVTIKGDLVVVDTYDLARRGQIKVARNRLFVPTTKVDPNDSDPDANSFEGGSNVAQVVAAQKLNDKSTIIIDDGSSDQNIFPPKLFPQLGKSFPSVRIGSKIKDVSGKLVKAGRVLLLVPSEPLKWTPAERPKRPDVGKADVIVASFNVLNYFTTIDDGKNNARGADSEAELERQESKIVAAIVGLNADVVGLMEIENNLEAETRLVGALNEKVGKQVFVGCGLPDNFRDTPGGRDAIRVGIIYRTDRVKPLGEVSLIRDEAFFRARTPIVQQFKSRKSGKPFTVIVNHFKSKGGASGADVGDKNKGDGQGAYNATRRGQALAVCNYINTLAQSNSKVRALVIGDLNAYDQEDPIDAMRAKGLVDLQKTIAESASSDLANEDYSFIFRGQSGTLDHAMATEALAKDVTGIATWHINSDEPRSMDYNMEYKPKSLFHADPFRSSDHDPVLIGIQN